MWGLLDFSQCILGSNWYGEYLGDNVKGIMKYSGVNLYNCEIFGY